VKAINGIDSQAAFSSEAGTGSRNENASSQQDGSTRQQGTMQDATYEKSRHMAGLSKFAASRDQYFATTGPPNV
jgi:hypothetical protein